MTQRVRKSGGKSRPQRGRPSAFAWSTALLAAGAYATSGGARAYDELTRRKNATGRRFPTRVTCWRWGRREPLFAELWTLAGRFAVRVHDGPDIPTATTDAAFFALSCQLVATEWEDGRAIGFRDDSPELRREIAELVDELKGER